MKQLLSNKTTYMYSDCLVAIGILTNWNNACAQDTNKDISDNARITSQAFDTLKAEQYEGAIRKADECIRLFRHDADDMQNQLRTNNAAIPPVGKVTDQGESEKILNRGPLNDVASCYFIQGEANAKLAAKADSAQKGQYLAKARAAYEAAARYTYARTWDTRGWFWSPAKTANQRLEDMEPSR